MQFKSLFEGGCVLIAWQAFSVGKEEKGFISGKAFEKQLNFMGE
ncbi:MAG: hypothetical protein ACLTOV_12170 [Phocaeicola sp.]